MARLIVTFLTLFGLWSAPAQAQQFENLDRLDSIVAMTVGANIGQPGGAAAPVDRRLKLAACPDMPQVSGPVFGAAMIECKPLGWRIRVPLMPGGAGAATPTAQLASYGRTAPVRREIIVKRGDAKTRATTSLNELLRD